MLTGSLNGHTFACAGGVEDRAKHIKKKRAQERKKNGKKGSKPRPGSASQVSDTLQAPLQSLESTPLGLNMQLTSFQYICSSRAVMFSVRQVA